MRLIWILANTLWFHSYCKHTKYRFTALEIKRELKQPSHLTLSLGQRIYTVIFIKHFITWLKERQLQENVIVHCRPFLGKPLAPSPGFARFSRSPLLKGETLCFSSAQSENVSYVSFLTFRTSACCNSIHWTGGKALQRGVSSGLVSRAVQMAPTAARADTEVEWDWAAGSRNKRGGRGRGKGGRSFGQWQAIGLTQSACANCSLKCISFLAYSCSLENAGQCNFLHWII